MARIAGVDLPKEKRVEIGLTYIYGIGLPTSQKILKDTGINPDTRVKDLTEDEVNSIRNIVKEMTIEGDLRREVALNIKRLVEIGLTYIYGIGLPTSQKILEVTGVNPDTRVKDLTEEEVNSIRNYIKDLTVEGDLRREVALNIKRLVEIGSYRGIRHRKGLPLRGQKTKTNARTRKGPKKTIANKKK